MSKKKKIVSRNDFEDSQRRSKENSPIVKVGKRGKLTLVHHENHNIEFMIDLKDCPHIMIAYGEDKEGKRCRECSDLGAYIPADKLSTYHMLPLEKLKKVNNA